LFRFFFQAEDGIRDRNVTGVQTCALPIFPVAQHKEGVLDKAYDLKEELNQIVRADIDAGDKKPGWKSNECEMKGYPVRIQIGPKIGRASCREREEVSVGAGDVEKKMREET